MRAGVMAWVRSCVSVLWPHELFSALWTFHPGAFITYVLGGAAANVPNFWRNMPPRAGMRTRRNWQRWCVPLALHGDGVAVANVRGTSSKTIDCLSWSSVLGTGPTRYNTFLIWFAFNHLVKKAGFGATWAVFWRKLSASLRAIWLGVWPAHNMEGEVEERAGQELAGGYWGVVYVNRGDLEWMASHFNFAHATSRHPCSLCQCTNLGGGADVHPWTDCNDPPSWLPTCLTDADHGAKHLHLNGTLEKGVLGVATKTRG